jgi:hypothetical protein
MKFLPILVDTYRAVLVLAELAHSSNSTID